MLDVAMPNLTADFTVKDIDYGDEAKGNELTRGRRKEGDPRSTIIA